MDDSLLFAPWLQTTLVALVTGMCVYWFIQKRRYKLPPGPFALPLVGNLLQMKGKMLHEQVFRQWVPKYGSVVSVYLGPKLIVFINDIDTALEVLVKKSTDFANRMALPSIDMMTMGSKDIAFGQYGPTWRLQRRIASKAFRHYMQGKALEERIHHVIGTILPELGKHTEAFDPVDYTAYIAETIITGLCFGERYDFSDKEATFFTNISSSKNAALNATIPEDIFPSIKYVYKSKPFKVCEKWLEDVYTNFIQKKYKEQEKTFDRNHMRHFTDNLILARLEADEEETGTAAVQSITDTHLLHTLCDIYIGGIDIIRYTLQFAILHMMRHQAIQAKVQEEIDQVVGHDRLPCLADRPNLSYTEAVLYESMRLGNVSPTGQWHLTSCDISLGEYQLPKGTLVAINHWALHHDPKVWDEVDKFIPERFLGKDGKLGPCPKNWLPFSAGKRACVAEFVAKPELYLIFACLMQRFKWKPEPGVVLAGELEGGLLSCQPKPFKVILEKRF